MEHGPRVAAVKRAVYPEAIDALIRELKRMPGVGPRSAERIALWLVQRRSARPLDIARAIETADEKIGTCRQCGFFAVGEICEICLDPQRARALLCVVEQPTDILPLERAEVFRGLYHALGGRISPLDHIAPDDLRIAELLERVRRDPPEEIILALSADVEGEATASYLLDALDGFRGRITRLAQGISAGMGLEGADSLTLGRALEGRRPMPGRAEFDQSWNG